MLEDIMRRLLMATLTFWRIVAVDVAAAIGTLGLLFAFAGLAGSITITHFLVAMAVGQVIGVIVALVIMPRTERWLTGMQRAAWRKVFGYGSWRAVQQLVRPALLASVRVVCLVGLGLAATGQLEAARIYVAPAMLVVGGVSAFLFATYANRRSTLLEKLIRMADRSVIGLVAAITLFGVVAVLALPLLGPLLTDGEYALQIPAVIGWVAFAASVAAATPYGSLAAVRGRQAAVLSWRVADSVISLVGAASSSSWSTIRPNGCRSCWPLVPCSAAWQSARWCCAARFAGNDRPLRNPAEPDFSARAEELYLTRPTPRRLRGRTGARGRLQHAFSGRCGP